MAQRWAPMPRPVGPVSEALAQKYVENLADRPRGAGIVRGDHPVERAAMHRVLIAASSELPGLIAGADRIVRDEAMIEAGNRGYAPAVPAIGKWVNSRWESTSALNALAKIGTKNAFAAIKKGLSNEDAYISLLAANLLAEHGDRSVAPVFRRWFTSGAFTNYRHPSFVNRTKDRSSRPMMYFSVTHLSSEEVRAATNALKVGYGDNAKELQEMLSGMTSAKRYILPDLASTRKAYVLAELKRLMFDMKEDHVVRKWAILVLAPVSNKSLTPLLIKAMNDPSPDVRFAAAETLGELGDASALPALDKGAGKWDGSYRGNTTYLGMESKAMKAAYDAAAKIRATAKG